MAERVGFEPTVPLQARRISSAVLSTTQPPLPKRRSGRARRPLSEGAEPSGERAGSQVTALDPAVRMQINVKTERFARWFTVLT